MSAMTRSSALRPLNLVLLIVAVAVVGLQGLRMLVQPIDYDAMEFLRAGWMMAKGKQPFIDFFQNHSPLYLALLAHAYDPLSPYYPIWTLVSHQLVIVAAAGLFATTLAGLVSPVPGYGRRPLVLGGFILFVALSPIIRGAIIRPETPAILMAMVAWALCCRQGWLSVLATMGSLGLAVLLSPRAAPFGLAVLAWAVWQAPSCRRVGRFMVAGVVAGAALLYGLSRVARLDLVWHWVVEFNRHLTVLHHHAYVEVTEKGDGTRALTVFFYQIGMDLLCVSGLVLFLVLAVRRRGRDVRVNCAILASVLTLGWMSVDRAWAPYSPAFLYLSATGQLTVVLFWIVRAQAAGRAWAPPVLTAMLLVALICAAPIGRRVWEAMSDPRQAGPYFVALRHLDVEPPVPAPTVLHVSDFMQDPPPAREMPLPWLRRMRDICSALAGETVLIPQYYPYCLDSASYHWVYWPQYAIASLRERPWYVVSDFAADFARSRPAIVVVSPQHYPALSQDLIAALPPGEYHRLGDVFVRNDLGVAILDDSAGAPPRAEPK